MRILLSALVLGAGYVSIVATLANVLHSKPGLAHGLAPFDGRITAALAQKSLEQGVSTANQAEAQRLSRLALNQDATAVRAASTLGLALEVRGERARARRVFAFAQSLSRRNLQTQLWAIEDAVGRNDIGEALRQYDIALRTSSVAPGLLFPVLGSAISDPVIRVALLKTLAARPSWQGNLEAYLAESGQDVRAAARLLLDIRRAKFSRATNSDAVLITRLVDRGFYDDAWAFYSETHSGTTRLASRDPDFRSNPTTPSLFDWNPLTAGGVSTSIQSGDRDGVFEFAASPTLGGELLTQMQVLPPGNYFLKGHSVGIDQLADARPYWVLKCRDGREAGRLEMPNSSDAGGLFQGRFTVPANCPVQTLTFIARPSGTAMGVSGQIEDVKLFREDSVSDNSPRRPQ